MEESECMDNQPSSSTRLYEEGVTSLERELDTYSKILVACNKRIQLMRSLAFNNEQCQYLVDTLKKVIESSSAVLESSHGKFIGSYASTKLEKHLLSFKILLVLATNIERFLEGCSQDAWVSIALALTNASEFVSSVGFHLELCQIALSKNCGASKDLNLNQVEKINKDVSEIVKIKTSVDKEHLLRKISLALPSLHGDKKNLAIYLLQRLLRVDPTLNVPSLNSKWDLFQYLTLLGNIPNQIQEMLIIGKGSTTIVYKSMWLEMEVAVKVFYGRYNPNFKREVDILARLYHFNITSIFCYIQERRKCSIIMELMDANLFTLMQQRLEKNPKSPPFNIWEAIDIMHQIAEGGKYLHEQGIMHRDLKSLNILVKRVKTLGTDLEYIQVKLADFNIAKIKESSTTNSELTMNVGSYRWMAPELIHLQSVDNQMNVGRSNQSEPKYPDKCDIYSFAMLCYEILSGEFPFADIDNPKMMKAMVLSGTRPQLPIQCPSQLRALIEKCWDLKPKSRPTFDDICRELKYVKYILMTDTSSTSKIHEGNYTDALKDFNKVYEFEPNDAFTLQKCGEVKLLMDKYADALEDLNKANELEPNDALTLKRHGEVKRLMGKYADALEDFNKANELKPDDAWILKRRGEIKQLMGKYADALTDFNKANELEPNDAFTLGLRGEVKQLLGNYVDALEDFNKANELEPNNALTLGSRGEVKQLMGKYADALEDFNKVDELKPNNALTLGSRGEVKHLMGNYVDALEDFNKADELKPNDAWILRNRGEVKRLMGKYANALEDLNKANELEPNDALTLKRRGDVKKMMDKYANALEGFNKGDELEPNDAFTLESRGEVKQLMDNYVDALEDFNKADELELNDAWIKEVGNLSSLIILNLSGCLSLVALPKEVGNLSSLITLNLSGCASVVALPKEVGNMSSLTTLDLSGCSSLVTLPKEVGNLSFLITLNLRQCSSLVALPKEVGNLSFLTTLNLEDCSILATLPKEVGNLSSLTTLNLWRCSSLTTLPKEVGNLSSLTVLNLRQCSSLTTLPKEVRSLSSLTTLNLEDCLSLATWPKEVEISSSFMALNLEECSSKAQVQAIGDDEHVLKKQSEEVVLTQFKAKLNLTMSKNFNDVIQELLVKILSFLTIKGLHVFGSLLLWVQFYTGIFGQQVLSWNKGKVQSKDLITCHFLGQGCSGILYETTWSQKSKVRLARKDFPGVPGDIFVLEAIPLFELRDHPNIVKTFCWTIDNRSCSLVMEYVKDDLSSFMRKKKEGLRKKGDQVVIRANPSPFQLFEALDILLQIAMGVEYIHDKGIYHGDLKPNNIFLDRKEGRMLVKVADFGLFETKRNTTLLSQRAFCFRMIEWSAPELFEDYFSSMSEDLDYLWTTSLTELDPSTSGTSYSTNGQKILMEKADSYNFGLTSAYVLGGELIWPAQFSPQELRKKISCDGLRPKLPPKCPKRLKSLIYRCWNSDPICRPTFSIIRNMMQDIMKDPLEVLGSL